MQALNSHLFGVFVVLVLRYTSPHASEPLFVESFPASNKPSQSGVVLHNSAQLIELEAEYGLQLRGNSYAEWYLASELSTDAGTLNMWVTPLWSSADQSSHTFATLKWSGKDESYFALSQGWWEPQGRRRLYVVLSNQQFLFCFTPWKFDYTLFLENQKTMLSVTWQAGDPGYIRLYADGKRLCERKITFSGGRHSLNPLYLGSDQAAIVESHDRPSDAFIERIIVANKAFTDAEINHEYVKGHGEVRSKWIRAIVSDDGNEQPPNERRLMLDEDTRWASSKLEIRRRIKRIKAAGFNVYIPCVWDGAHAFYSMSDAPSAPGIHDPRNPRYDPLNYLIATAHSEGIEVHPWFVVTRRAGAGVGFPESFLAGAPQDAFNIQNAEFRNFIVKLVLDVARRYEVDGLNLDYVRAIGPCSDKACLDRYYQKYKRSLLQDWQAHERGERVPSLIEWNRSAVTDIVRRISAGTRALRPNAILTIDTVPFDSGREHQGLDEAGWLHEKLVDGLVDMAYDDPLDIDTLDQAMRAFSPERQIVAVRNYDFLGEAVVDSTGVVMSDYVRLIRSRWPGAGIAFYHYPHLNSDQILVLQQGVFSGAATSHWMH
jgi:uncharacterized lipoprotein YddW (UPF0748 family)